MRKIKNKVLKNSLQGKKEKIKDRMEFLS